MFLATLNENMIDKEHTLTNYRITWMMSTQAFLFSAFCYILISTTGNKHEELQKTAIMLLKFIPLFGATLGIVSGLGILAAQNVLEVLERERSSYRDVLATLFGYHEMPDIGFRRVGRLGWTRFGGIWPPRLVVCAIVLLWLFVLFTRFGIVDRGA